jgi:hypothetical protein
VPVPITRAEAQATQPDQPSYVQRDSIRVVYWGDGLKSAEAVLAAAHAPFPLPGIAADYRLSASTIFLAPDRAAFDSLASGQTPHWAAGVAIPSRRIIISPAAPERSSLGSAVVTLRHEIAHLVLNDYLGADVPRWFDEGYATWVSGGWDQGTGWQIRLALVRGHAPRLDSLSLSWPREAPRARLAYLLSASAVAHLANSRGTVAFAAFLSEWRATGDMEAAMRGVYQLQPELFEREWRSMVRRRYGWLLALSQVTVFWVAIAGLVFLLGIARRRRNRERLEALRREEYMIPR